MSPSRPIRVALTLVALTTACSDSPTAPLTATTLPPATSGAGSPPGIITVGSPDKPLTLVGGGFLTEYDIDAPEEWRHMWNTAVVASTGAMIEENGRCCRVMGDTILQLNYPERVGVGSYTFDPQRIEITDDFYHYGKNDALLMVREGRWIMRFFVPSKPATLTITRFVEPVGDQEGIIEGTMVFEADQYVREANAPDAALKITKAAGITMIYATFRTPMRYQYRKIVIPRG